MTRINARNTGLFSRYTVMAGAVALVSAISAGIAQAESSPFGSPAAPTAHSSGDGAPVHGFGGRDTPFGSPGQPSSRGTGNSGGQQAFGAHDTPFGAPAAARYEASPVLARHGSSKHKAVVAVAGKKEMQAEANNGNPAGEK